MFNVSFLVADNKLPDTLARLHQIVQIVTVTHLGTSLNNAEQPASLPTAAAIAKATKVKVKRHFRKRPPSAGEGTQDQRCLTLIQTYGSAPFQVKSYLEKSERLNLNKAAAYRALRMAIDAGDLNRLEPGIYQRTGQGMSKSLNPAQKQA